MIKGHIYVKLAHNLIHKMFPMIKFILYLWVFFFLFCFDFVSVMLAKMIAVIIIWLEDEDWYQASLYTHLPVGKRPAVLQVNYKRMFSNFFLYFLALTDNWWKDCKAGPLSQITRLGTSFSFDEPTNIRDAWEIYIKLALDFFNSIKTGVCLCIKDLYIGP